VDLTDRFAARHDEVTCLHALNATNVVACATAILAQALKPARFLDLHTVSAYVAPVHD
jgi:hypothetical protein